MSFVPVHVSKKVCDLLCLVQDLKANESRLRDINKVASELESEGLMTEEAPMVQAQVSSPPWVKCVSHLCVLDVNYWRSCVFHLQQQELLGVAPGKVVIISVIYIYFA